ncbi:MAG: methyltransferase domain-containing protein [Xanthomonadaceae bacterium]|nr:methyltransferase domain-containing protein [Xanthomonadaceae bacterium]MDE1963571.1 methyltransferase domain-containing protein [Xanthomonadaceae bacterium]
MSAASTEIFASAPLRRLLADEVRGLLPDLQRCRGDHGLLISAIDGDCPPGVPMLSCWTRLVLSGPRYGGDVVGRVEEPLPFVDDAFELVVLRHALETVTAPAAWLDESLRVLAPGGVCVVSGLHPVSLWMPWLAWHTRRHALRLHMPLQIGEWLRRRDMQVECVRRLGPAWPRVEGGPGLGEALGGAYVLIARKRRRAVTPLRLVPRPLKAPVDVGLAPGARRNIA